MLRPSPLRAVRASFPAYSSSLLKPVSGPVPKLTNADDESTCGSLRYLSDTNLNPPDIPLFTIPIDLVPVFRFAGECRFHFGWNTSHATLPFRIPLNRRLEGTAFAAGHVSCQYPFHYKTAFDFCILLYPLPQQIILRITCPIKGVTTGLPSSPWVTEQLRCRLFAAGTNGNVA